MNPLPVSFYQRNDVVLIARELLGKVIETNLNGIRTSGIITETEAYSGFNDKASHAFGGRRTPRNEPMYAPGGIAYVYLCYGIHRLFNVVTNVGGIPHAVLIRAMVPCEGINAMEIRRKLPLKHPKFSAGPGTLTQALGIGLDHTGFSLQSATLRIYPNEIDIPNEGILATPRIGIDYAEEHALLPYRFIVDESSLDRIRKSTTWFTGNR